MAQPIIRVVVADAHPPFTLGLRALLAKERGIKVVGDASDGTEALHVLQRTRPDVFLLDLLLQRVATFDVLSRMATMKLPTRTVIMAAAIDSVDLRTVLLRGARGILLKHQESDLITKCVRQVASGQYWIRRGDLNELIDALRRSQGGKHAGSGLSLRELDVVRAVLKGASNRDIATQLGLGEQTVKNHLRRIFAKRGVANRVELAVHAIEHHLTDSDTESVRPPGEAEENGDTLSGRRDD